MRFLIASFLFATTAPLAFALDPKVDAASQEALQKTQQLLKNPAARNEALKNDPLAIKADQNLKNTGLSQGSQEAAYGLSSEILETLVKETGGDPLKLQDRAQALMRNPASLEKSLTPEQRQMIKRMAEEIQPSQPGAH